MEAIVRIAKKRTVDTFDLIFSIDIYLLRVELGKRKGWMATWCQSGRDIIEVMKENKEIRLQRLKERYGWEFKSWLYETYEFYFPGATNEAKAESHFKKMMESAPTTKFEKTNL